MLKGKWKYIILGILSGVALFLIFGIVTDLISNPWFIRMVPKSIFDYIFLLISSILLGTYVGVHFYKKNTSKKCEIGTYTGGIGSFLAFGCPICNKLLVLLFGATTLMTYLEPYRPILGFGSIAMLGGVLYWRVKN